MANRPVKSKINKKKKKLLNFVKQSDIFDIVYKEKRKPGGLRFPESLEKEIREIMKIEKKDNFSAIVVDLCWKGVDRYYREKKAIENVK